MEMLEAVKSAKAIGWDTCHKIYVLMDDEQVSKMIEYGYGDDMIYAKDTDPQTLLNTLRDWYDNSCSLRFIQAVRTAAGDPNEGFTSLIEQGEDWVR